MSDTPRTDAVIRRFTVSVPVQPFSTIDREHFAGEGVPVEFARTVVAAEPPEPAPRRRWWQWFRLA